MSVWSDGQCAEFARRFAQSAEGRAWWAFVDDVREALIDAFVLSIVLGQDKGAANVEDIRAMRVRFVRKLAIKHHLTSPTYESTITPETTP